MALILASALASAVAAAPAASSNKDAEFIRAALQSGTAEIQQGSVEADMSDSYVHDFADKMVSDHQAANSQLLSLANQLHVRVPADAAPQAAASYSPSPALNAQPEMAKQTPAVKYFEEQIKAHQQAIALFQKESATGSNAQVRAFAKRTLPTLQSHLALAKKDLSIEKSRKH